MAGSNPFLIDRESESFRRSFRKLYKATAKGLQNTFLEKVELAISGLADDPRPTSSRLEPQTSKISLPPLFEFRKLEFTISTGASGQIRLMYLVNFDSRTVKPLFIYSHKQFSKRPPSGELTDILKNALED